jgi:hypothetical protein
MSETIKELMAHLAAPFPADAISWRVGSTTKDKKKGMALAYISARDVMNRLDSACGSFGWQSEHIVAADGKKVTCRIGIRHPENGEWIWKSDGAGETDVEGEKGSYSDSLKRAAVAWNIGRYLYDAESPWVELEAAGNSYKIAAHEYARLRKSLEGKSASRAVAPATKATPASAAAKPAPSDDLKFQAETLVKKIKEADTLFKLDVAMEDGRELCKKLPQATYDYIGKLYDQRRTAMERAA